MAAIDIDIEDYLYEVDTDDLIDELNERGYQVSRNNEVLPSNTDVVTIDTQQFISPQYLRDILLDITGQGHYVTDEQLLNKIQSMLK